LAPYPHATDDTSDILKRLEAIEAQLATLRERAPWLFALNAPVARSEPNLSEQAGQPMQDTSYTPLARPTASVARLPSPPPDVPAGSVQLTPFATAHGVAAGTAKNQQERGIIEVTSRPSPRRDNYMEHWLTPAQQHAAVEEWR